jgi:hypothetical protein
MTVPVLASTIRAYGAVGVALISPRRDAALSPVGWQRTLLVVGNDAELAVALRDRLDRAYLTVFEVRPDEASEAVHACRPWPWMVVGATPEIPEPLRHALAVAPDAACVARSATTAHAALPQGRATLLRARRGGRGGSARRGRRDSPCGGERADHAGRCARLEPGARSLVSNHPRPVRLSARQIRSAAAALAAHGVPLRPRLADGGAVLVPAEVR